MFPFLWMNLFMNNVFLCILVNGCINWHYALYSKICTCKTNWTLKSTHSACSLYSKKAQAITVNKLLATNNTINGDYLIETGRSGTNYFAKVNNKCSELNILLMYQSYTTCIFWGFVQLWTNGTKSAERKNI